ncbi:MAG: cytochrome c [Labilithrix sp.]|nr:cytochrome c [Labilithrix sp.]MBX3221006.1 cytochrome c [Labilithrix sp.]
MTKRMLACFVTATMIVACADEENENPNPPREQPGETSALSASFQSVCATCHGDDGKGKGKYPSIPGGKDESAFIAIVRSGRGDMPASDASRISDADLKADYLWLTTKRE